MTRPDVSVVIPTFNRWESLRWSLDSAIYQRRVAIEVIVVDDGSPSAAPEDVQKRESVRLLTHAGQRGVAAARNTGIAAAKAPWIAFLDDDDVWAPDRLDALLSVLRRNAADFAYSAAIVVDRGYRPLFLQRPPDPRVLRRALLRWNAMPGGGSSVVARAARLRELGGFDTSFSFAADWDMWLRLAEEAKPTAVTEPLVAYCQHPGSWVLSGDPAVTEDIERIERKHAESSRDLGVSMDRAAFDRYTATSLWLSSRPAEARRRYIAVARRHRDAKSLLGAARTALTPRQARWLRNPIPPDPAWLVSHRASRRS